MALGRLDMWTRRRLTLAVGGLATALGVARVQDGTAKRNGKGKGKKRRPVLCRENGTRCRTKSDTCQKRLCPKAPLYIDSSWSGDFYTSSYLFVPKQNANTGPSPYVDFGCTQAKTLCESQYPFACVVEDQLSPGSGRSYILEMLPGTYEYWVRLNVDARAGEVVVSIRNIDETLLNVWSSPANPGNETRGWHVFDVDGKTGVIKTIDKLTLDGEMPDIAHERSTDVCPV